MSDVSKQSLAVLRQVSEFLEGLPIEQVNDLAEGRARLTLIPWGSSEPLMPTKKPARKTAQSSASAVNAEEIAAKAEAAMSREDVQALLNPLKVAEVKAVAAALRVAGPAGTKAALIKQIVELTVGARLSGDALRAL
ncbi:MAG TPA: hypothetical protein VFC19_15625 [Candidatus Limnocylindrales bacterium]|nr:hypothetical protein [Candidatus Limnocylindrales bacterium]